MGQGGQSAMNLETIRKAGDALEDYLRKSTTLEFPASSHWLAKVVLEAVEGDIRAEALRDAGADAAKGIMDHGAAAHTAMLADIAEEIGV